MRLKKIKVSGAKNSATRLLAASLISDESCTLYNFPTKLVDANYKKKFIEKVGGYVKFDDVAETAYINSEKINDRILKDYNFPIRTTYLLVPGLLKKTGIAKIPYPGGCKIGNRGYDLHVMVWESMGATVTEKENYIEIEAKELKGTNISFPITTIGGTESALICGSIAIGTTTINNAYISPEVLDLIRFLRGLGVNIEVVGNSLIHVTGQNYHIGTSHKVIPDRIEAITWMIFAALSGIPLQIDDIPFHDMQIPLLHLQDAGIDFFSNKNSVIITQDSIPNGIQPFELAMGTHPGIISDMQPFYVLLGLKATGTSRIYDYRYPKRVTYLEELSKFVGNNLIWREGAIQVMGNAEFNPATANSTDLRGSMAVLIAALLAKDNGTSKIHNIHMALRGYNNLEEKLRSLDYNFQIIDDTLILMN